LGDAGVESVGYPIGEAVTSGVEGDLSVLRYDRVFFTIF
jgi:hypothetical protein